VDVADYHMAALKKNDYAQAGLVDAGAEKFYVTKGPEGMWCRTCVPVRAWHNWTKVCPKCGELTVPESELNLPKMQEYIP
jgi:Zn finger protein HypA/HybF involved in hydrogenase expression